MKPRRRKRVLIIQAECKLYREALYLQLNQDLSDAQIDLRVVYSDPPPDERKRKDSVQLPSPLGQERRGLWFVGHRLLLQLCFLDIWWADLVVVEHSLKYLLNPFLLLLCVVRLKRLAFWIHGGPLRHPGPGLAYKYRRWTMLAADWRFAYTSGVAELLVRLGADPVRTTPVHNSIDLSSFRTALQAVTPEQIAFQRMALGIPNDGRVALFCGSLYADKGLDFLVEAGDRIHAADPLFHLILIGSGSDRQRILDAAAERSWLHYQGAVHGSARAVFFRIAELSLVPYLTGLGILDAMAAGLPYIVTGARVPNPEIDYLVDGVTGLSTGDNVGVYADRVAGLLADPKRLTRMSKASREASQQYSIQRMSAQFAKGIRACLMT